MITEKNIIIPIYRYAVKIVIASSVKEASEKFVDIKDNTAKGTVLEYEDKCIIVVPPDDISTIVHECEHMKNAVWDRIGYTPIVNNDEPDAYLLEYIFNEVMKVVKKHLVS